ncbi:gag-pol polyprotein [Cucumis melo var. makuwa]|uniref:Gag-pol polyprotein n=1 Tax=Cucumis melo var. makuwa TaxID=1194695 RepID=A0A5A7UW34_CUCMM|nr:gag-pol polyprotein [Cucumis melo var. makuwa]TYK26885.1 gag-pol polyprotein [Cucumis melo var. makuwa]
MTGNQSFFSELTECSSGHVTFEDGAKGLKANLISVSQLCDQGYTINFSKEECIVTDINNNVLMSGTRQYHGFLGITMVANSQSSHLSNDELTSVLSQGTLSVWSVNEISVVSLSVKYVILHKIGITNWFSSSHASSAADQSQE